MCHPHLAQQWPIYETSAQSTRSTGNQYIAHIYIGIGIEISTVTHPLGSSGAEFEEKTRISYSCDCSCQNDHFLIFLI